MNTITSNLFIFFKATNVLIHNHHQKLVHQVIMLMLLD